jgi:ribonuclease HI
MTICAWGDGACHPNPGGKAAYGIVIRETDAQGHKKVLHTEGKFIGEGKQMSNNVAEYEALIASLKWIRKNKLESEDIVILSDSMLVVKQMSKRMGVGHGLYSRCYPIARMLAFGLKIKFVWVPREKNWQANALAVSARKGSESL